MKFGEKLRNEKVPEWFDYYLDYDKLKDMIKELEQKFLNGTNYGAKGKLQVCDE